MPHYKYVFFDVAGTLLHKPQLFTRIDETLRCFGIAVDSVRLRERHKLLSEAIAFPPKTSSAFYNTFNAELLYSLGIMPEERLLTAIFEACTYLPWERFADADALESVALPAGIISNWDASLPKRLKTYFNMPFCKIVVSGVVGVSKPDRRIYEQALEGLPANASEILYVGDSLKLDIQPALQVGMTAVLLDRDDFYANYDGLKLRNLHELPRLLAPAA